MIEVITTKEDWNLLINEVDEYDFYSTYDYHVISNVDNEKPILIKYTEGDVVIAIPLLIRKIPNTPYFDATSVYGYAGPISKNITDNFDNKFFKKELNNYFIDNRIVSVFSRLNPYLAHQNDILRTIGEVKIKGDIVMIEANSKDDIKAFIELYYENMNRVDAKKSYFFSEDYFYKFTHIDNCKIDILLATLIETNEIISGAMFVKTKDIIQYHLSGTKTEYLDTSALKLLIDEMRIEGSQENYRVFNLGGGLSSNDDSLLRFKKSFSKTLKDFSVWQYIVNEKIYYELTESVEIDDCEYFPGYRCHK